jgi:UDP-N-acetylmuramate dehydrogenase
MLKRDVSLKSLNTFGFGIKASIFKPIASIDELGSVWKTNLFTQSSPLILGGGSNILFTKDYNGLVLKNEIVGRKIVEENTENVLLKIGGGENWHQIVVWAVKQGWGGIENLSLIPGSVGAAPIQNIGAYGVELEKSFHYLEAFDMVYGKMVKFSHNECEFGYRDSIFKNAVKGRYFITQVYLKLSKIPQLNVQYGDIQAVLDSKNIVSPTISDISETVIEIRKSKLPDPAEIGNCGSFFKNPIISELQFLELRAQFDSIKSFPSVSGFVKVPAAWLIEQCGWKGYRLGDAGVHSKQALVLVNYGHATGIEIYNLALEMQESVYQKFGISLEMEVNIR